MQLKRYLQQQLRTSSRGMHKQIDTRTNETDIALQKLNQINNLNTACYIVSIYSSSKDETSTVTKWKGLLDEAVRKAEQEFKKANNNKIDVKSGYLVQIKIGKITLVIPDEYWKQYREQQQDFPAIILT